MLQKKKAQAEAAQKLWFEAIYRTEYSKMLRLARLQMLRSGLPDAIAEDRAQDAVQLTFAIAWDYRKDLMQKESPIGWLYEALKYKTMSVISAEWKWRNRMEQLELYGDTFFSDPSVDSEAKLLLSSMVSPEDLLLLKKLYLGGYTYDTLSREMGISRSALAMKVHRLKKKLSEESKK